MPPGHDGGMIDAIIAVLKIYEPLFDCARQCIDTQEEKRHRMNDPEFPPQIR